MTTSTSSSHRIAPIDGLRAVAVVGVLWAHMWSFGFGAPPLAPSWARWLDFHRVLGIGGSGVELFFVISGFCMYLMYASRQTGFNWSAYQRFLVGRWRRIAPAFYVAATFSAVVVAVASSRFPIRDLLAHLTFTYPWVPGTGHLNAPFWSLATEWQFYLVLPLLVTVLRRWPFPRAFGALVFVGILCRGALAYEGEDAHRLLWDSLLNHLVAFAWGIGVAHAHRTERLPPRLLRGGLGALAGAAIALAGRLLDTTEARHAAGAFAWICVAAAEPILTLGCAVLAWNAIGSASTYSRLLQSQFMQLVGRWSYSLYLWHMPLCLWISAAVVERWGSSPLTLYMTFFGTLAVLIPLSGISHALLEAPYFRNRTKTLGAESRTLLPGALPRD